MSTLNNKARLSILLVMKAAGCGTCHAAGTLADAMERGKLSTGRPEDDARMIALYREIAANARAMPDREVAHEPA